MKKFIYSILAVSTFSISVSFAKESTIRQYPYVYKSIRAMGMGGAYTAVGGRTDAVFYNPATLMNMPERKFEITAITPALSAGSNVIDFINDMKDAFDVGDLNRDGDTGDDQLKYVNNVLAKYRGDNMHLNLSNWTSVGGNNGKMAFAVGGLINARLDAMSHQGFGENGFLEINAEFIGGGVGGLAYKVNPELYIGAGLKLLHRESLMNNFTAKGIVENQDRLDNYIQKDLRKSGNALGVDLGTFYRFDKYVKHGEELKPAVGLTVQNIGDLNFKNAGKIPMTINFGVSINPTLPYVGRTIVAFDYVDLFNNYKQDKDIGKRIRIGTEINPYQHRLLAIFLRVGLYQGYPTFGTDLKLLFLNFSYATYAEEVGAYAGQIRDRRHMFMFSMGW
ncbi:MAG: hypothetical protein N2Z80_04350 [Hydrogenothermaceae bacterium]|nr:hypothetical protein [Hydrogenothermaceae bacterium]